MTGFSRRIERQPLSNPSWHSFLCTQDGFASHADHYRPVHFQPLCDRSLGESSLQELPNEFFDLGGLLVVGSAAVGNLRALWNVYEWPGASSRVLSLWLDVLKRETKTRLTSQLARIAKR